MTKKILITNKTIFSKKQILSQQPWSRSNFSECAHVQDYVSNVLQTCAYGHNEQKLANMLSNLAINCKLPKKRGHHEVFVAGLTIF
jgi:hypothetical protein